MIRDRVFRLASIGLVVYGLFGIALVALGYPLASRTFVQVEAVGKSLSGQRAGLVGMLRATSATVDSTATSIDNVDRTVVQARDSSRQAAELSRGMSKTMGDIAQVSQVQILGFAPFGQLGQSFGQASQQMQQLGSDLDGTATVLGQNSDDLRAVRANLVAVRGHVDTLAGAFDAIPLLGGSPWDLEPLRLAIYGLLVWLAGQAIVSVLLGAVLFDWSQRRIHAYVATQKALPPPALEADEGSALTRVDAA